MFAQDGGFLLRSVKFSFFGHDPFLCLVVIVCDLSKRGNCYIPAEAGQNNESTGNWDRTITAKELQNQYHQFLGESGVLSKKDQTHIGLLLKKFVPDLVVTKASTGTRGKIYHLPDLKTCRDKLFPGFDWSQPL